MVRFAKIFLDCTSRDKAARIVEHALAESEGVMHLRTIEPRVDQGFIAICDVDVLPVAWPEEVCRLLAIAQRLGRSWTLTGVIEEELDLWCKSSSIAGVTAIQLSVSNHALHSNVAVSPAPEHQR